MTSKEICEKVELRGIKGKDVLELEHLILQGFKVKTSLDGGVGTSTTEVFENMYIYNNEWAELEYDLPNVGDIINAYRILYVTAIASFTNVTQFYIGYSKQ